MPVERVTDSPSFVDSDGVRWTVREEGKSGFRAAFGSDTDGPVTWLRFESELEVRKLWRYPDDWMSLAPAQLEALCRRGSTIVARFPRQRASPPSAERSSDGSSSDG